MNDMTFVGRGDLHRGPWHRSAAVQVTDLTAFGHPARYSADNDLSAAVNTALLLDKPLLLTGSPGTGKSELAERIAWEFQLGAVERFEAQSLSEANDLFYRFDLVGRMAARHLSDSRGASLDNGRDCHPAVTDPVHPANFIEFGPLGRALLRASVEGDYDNEHDGLQYQALRRAALARDLPNTELPPRRSVVLIDEIDKASRDFPNDLLNNIDRTEFRIKELNDLPIFAPDRDAGLHPIIIITSNQERDLPGPFLRRCTFFHIPDPTPERLREIVRARVFPERPPGSELSPFFRGLLDFFVEFREDSAKRLSYTPGTSELIDVSRALKRAGIDEGGSIKSNVAKVRSAVSAMAKHRDDLDRLRLALDEL